METTYTGKEWTELLKNLSSRELKNTLKRSYRVEAKKVLGIARRSLQASGMQVKGNKADWTRGVRSYVYSKGGGFLVTVKAKASVKGKGEKSMHTNRRGDKKPILMWAEEGTKTRTTRAKMGARSGWLRKAKVKKKGANRGRMPAYGFLDKAESEMFRTVENDLVKDLGDAVTAQARKSGFI
jgi:hypothetical protein